MNVMWYAGKFDEACWQLLAMMDLQRSRFARDGTGMAAVEQHIQYKREPHAGDAVTIQSALLEVKDKFFRMLHKMMHDASGEVAATTVVMGFISTQVSARQFDSPKTCVKGPSK
jgi:acyl-CoA thioester hydrolase